MPTHAPVHVLGLGKTYGKVVALDGISFTIDEGSVLGVLGHNGAGKTSLIDILTTGARPTSGAATICGWDVVRFPHHVRRSIGVAGQFATVDEELTGRAQLVLLARLYGAGRRAARDRADELIDAFGLADAARRKVRTYSGGMRRKLDLAAGLVARPPVLFLDEPTTGLDPVSRNVLWEIVTDLAHQGTAVLLTTQYLDEADVLADTLIVLARGRVVAEGRPADLKRSLGNRTVAIRFPSLTASEYAAQCVASHGFRPVRDSGEPLLRIPVSGTGDIASLVRTLDGSGVDVGDLTVSEPTLDDVYLALHGAGDHPG
ncbi:ABC-2 type transport system ATP-binding protein [Haloechinothrix alba]|uniref:ABC-2 type transport system ATP-binding protein n=1 Tax=Haloechinothrix alba TaxID=664784 RepID=A0A238VG62_9PSEU|nr:ATP-binding cassette domain-containing protein [Haloechinothrix alba]SNR33067.1 ABC-2 type transport system ATP-binding protein [Haloechinothrix alba]